MTPFEAVYRQPLATIHSYVRGETLVAQVEQSLRSRDEILQLLKESLVIAQQRMKINVDRHRRELEFAPGDFVYLRLQPFRQLSVRTRGNQELSPRFYGPYQVVERLGTVSYQIALPTDSWIHPVFHVSQLKKQLGRSDRAAQELPKCKTTTSCCLNPPLYWIFAGARQERKCFRKPWCTRRVQLAKMLRGSHFQSYSNSSLT